MTFVCRAIHSISREAIRSSIDLQTSQEANLAAEESAEVKVSGRSGPRRGPHGPRAEGRVATGQQYGFSFRRRGVVSLGGRRKKARSSHIQRKRKGRTEGTGFSAPRTHCAGILASTCRDLLDRARTGEPCRACIARTRQSNGESYPGNARLSGGPNPPSRRAGRGRAFRLWR